MTAGDDEATFRHEALRMALELNRNGTAEQVERDAKRFLAFLLNKQEASK